MSVIKELESLLESIRLCLKKEKGIYGEYEILPCYCMYYLNKSDYTEIQKCLDFLKDNITNNVLLNYLKKSYVYNKEGESEKSFNITVYRKECYWVFSTLELSEEQFDDFYLFSLVTLCFNYFKSNYDLGETNSTYVLSKDDLIDLYEKKGIKIVNEDEFKKNELVTFNPKFHFLDVDNNNRVLYDQRLKISFEIDIDWIIAKELTALFLKNYIKKMSFRLIKISRFIAGLEQFQTGQPFDLKYDNLKSKKTLLYLMNDKEVSLNDKLIVKTEAKSITFEEIYNDENVETIDNFILTRVVHFQIEKLENTYYITHFDYEKIYYSKDDYKLKLNNTDLKGQKKIKFFKVDSAKIPLDYEISVPLENGNKKTLFIYLIVHNTFIYKELVDEYFSKYIC